MDVIFISKITNSKRELTMKKLSNLILLLFAIFIFSGCMTERQAWLTSKDMQAKQAWPAFGEIVMEGPLNIPQGGKLVIPYPNQPYKNYPVPDDGARIAGTITNGVQTAAVVGTVIYGLHKAGHSGTTKNTTINNNAAAAQP